ncbi:fimbrial protein [Enterobacter wuhouensis]|uniref:fimbrial protein n=1 Tax=Enterobacter wuhouensis TaxID=2529381 RepID=UPI002FD4EECA
MIADKLSRNMWLRAPRLGMGGLLLVLSMQTKAVTTITVKVTVLAPPPCIVNDNRPIEVEFGDVITTRVDGMNYQIPVNYTLSCEAEANNAMQLQVQGAGAVFDNSVLQTNRDGLGIKLMRVGAELPINSWIPFTYPDAPELWAVPVKETGATLTTGEFSAAASIRVDYQ